MDIDLSWDKLPAQEICYDDDQTGIVHFSGGLGCVKESTLVDTINGKVAVEDIPSPTVYYSKNAQHKPSLYPGTAPYPKGKDYLYRVIHERGEFEVSGSHQIFCETYGYQSVLQILELLKVSASVRILSPTNQELFQSESPLNDPYLKKKAEGFLEHYGSYIHQYGQQLQSSEDSGQAFFPIPFDVHIFDRIVYQAGFWHTGDQGEQTLGYNHLDQCTSHPYKQDLIYPKEELDEVVSSKGFLTKPFEYISQYIRHRLSQLSLSTSSSHRLVDQLNPNHACASLPSSSAKSSSLITIEKTSKQWFFDLHVFGSNNYLAGNAYHHNSGKTYFLCRKAIKLSVLNRGYAGGFLVPAYSDFKRDVEPTFEDIFHSVGLVENQHYWFNRTSKEYRFVWNKKPLYIFTGEKPIAGPNLAYCLINEFSLIQYERIKEMLRRVRVKEAPCKQKIMAGTPEDVHGWLEEFIELQQDEEEKNPGSYKLVFADTRENVHIDDSYRRHLETMLDEQSLKVFASGQICRIGGDYFYYAFDTIRNVTQCDYYPSEPIHVGVDFNVGQMNCSFSHKLWNPDTGQHEQHFFDEIKLETVGADYADTEKLGIAIKNRYPIEDVVITCDAAGRARKTSGISDVETLERQGFQVRYTRANPRLRDRQLLVNGLLAHGRIKIDPKCKNLIRDLSKVQQNKADFTKVKDKDDRLTHMSDGLDYVINWEYNLGIKRSRTLVF